MAARETLLEQAQALARELPGFIGDRVELLSLELQSAGQALVQIVALVVAVGILGLTAWVVLWAAIVSGFVAMGLPMAAALILALAVNVVAAGVAVWRVKQLLERLSLPATRRHLTLGARHSSADDTGAIPPQDISHESSASFGPGPVRAPTVN